MKTYAYIVKDKPIIYKENIGKIGVYRWVNNINGKSSVGYRTNTGNRLSIYNSKFKTTLRVYCNINIIYVAPNGSNTYIVSITYSYIKKYVLQNKRIGRVDYGNKLETYNSEKLSSVRIGYSLSYSVYA